MSDQESAVIAICAVMPMVILLFCLMGVAIHDYRKVKRHGGSFWR